MIGDDQTTPVLARKHGIEPFRVVVVHGGPGAAGEMGPVAQRLGRARGVLEPMQTAATVAAQVEELRTAVESLAISPVVLIGHSWGAWLSCIVTATYPKLTRKLILIGTPPFEDKYVHLIRENRMTRLAIDFQVVIKDVFLRNYLNDVNGPVDLVVPKDFHTNVYRLDGATHAEDVIPAGLQTLSTDQAMTLVLGEELDPHGKVDERSYRKDLLLKVLSCQVRQRFAARDVGFSLSLVRFSLGELGNHNLSSDFDFQLIAGGLGKLAQAFVVSGGAADATFPEVSGARELVVHAEAFGDGGVRRVHDMLATPDDRGLQDHPLVKQELRLGSLAPYMLLPIGGNPYATDLVSEYWSSVRDLVKATLLREGATLPPK